MSNKKPQNDEVLTSKFDIPCSIFCGSKKFYSNQILIFSIILCALRALCGEILTPWPRGENADFVTPRNTIGYPSFRQIAPGFVFIGFEAWQLSTVSGSFNEIRYEKQIPQQRGAGPSFQNPLCYSGWSEKPHRYQLDTHSIFFDSRFRMTPPTSLDSSERHLSARRLSSLLVRILLRNENLGKAKKLLFPHIYAFFP